jgi:hypothetical protein
MQSKPNDFEAMRAYAQRWKTLGPILEDLRRTELRAMTEAEHQSAVEALLDLAAQNRYEADETTTGLFEQQRRFSLLRRA